MIAVLFSQAHTWAFTGLFLKTRNYCRIFGLKNYVTIVGPDHVRKGMIEMLEAVGKRYE